MRRRRWERWGPPPWWPEGEAWPPPGYEWRRRRSRFIGRIWFIVSIVWVFSTIGFVSVVSRLMRHAGGGAVFDGSWRATWFLLALAAFIGVVSILRRIGSPVGDLVGAAHRIANGDFDARVPERGPRSVRVVAAAFNDMAGRLAKQERQRRELMADIAHELRTPLAVVQGRLEGLIDGVYPRETAQIQPLLDETRVLARLVDDLRTLANAESGVLTLDREPTDIDMLLRDAASAVADDAAAQHITVHTDASSVPVVSVDPVRMRQVFVNLLANAVRHGGANSTVTASGTFADGRLMVRVVDTGPGIPPEDLPRIFDRFYKRSGSTGSGLGLTIARTLVRAHGGEIRAESRVGAGTTIVVSVPVSA